MLYYFDSNGRCYDRTAFIVKQCFCGKGNSYDKKYNGQSALYATAGLPVADKEQNGIGSFIGLYGGEHIAATEFVIGATLGPIRMYGKCILIGLFIGNFLAVICFTFFCAKIATDTRLTLYSYLGRIFGNKLQKVYNIVLGLGLAALAAAASVFRERQFGGYSMYRYSLTGILPVLNLSLSSLP